MRCYQWNAILTATVRLIATIVGVLQDVVASIRRLLGQRTRWNVKRPNAGSPFTFSWRAFQQRVCSHVAAAERIANDNATTDAIARAGIHPAQFWNNRLRKLRGPWRKP